MDDLRKMKKSNVSHSVSRRIYKAEKKFTLFVSRLRLNNYIFLFIITTSHFMLLTGIFSAYGFFIFRKSSIVNLLINCHNAMFC